MKRGRDVRLWAALGFGLAVGLAGVFKPVHIDDALYLNVARRIVTHPLDPYGGVLNWQQVPEPTYYVSTSPPLMSYWYAAVLLVAGENVPLLHLSVVPWVVLACWGVFRLGERWAGAGLTAVLLVIGGPAVVVGLNLMLDVPLTACLCAAVEFLARGVGARPSRRSLLAASAFAAAAVGIKFAGVALVPIFLVAAVTRRRWGPAFAALGPAAALVGWQVLSRSLYGMTQVDAGFSLMAKLRTSFVSQTAGRTLTMAAILATTLPLWAAVPWRGRRAAVALVLAAGATAAAAWLLASAPVNRAPGVTPALLAAVFLGTYGLAAVVGSERDRPGEPYDPRPWLAVWVAAGAAVVILFGPFVAVRSFLPVHPPLVVWLLGSRDAGRRRVALGATVALTLATSLGLGVADFRWAATYPEAVRQIAARYGRAGRPIEFLGHWGWQYYAERAGFRAWDARRLDTPAGAVLVIPLRADRQFIHPALLDRMRPAGEIAFPANPLGLTTWNREAGFRFYGGDFGQLPWGFSREPVERFLLYEPR